MNLSLGIVGLPNVGKSTLFNALTKKQIPAENFPFCTIDPNFGVVPVADDRLYKIAEIARPEKVIPAYVEFVDIAGLVKGASQGEGLGNQFLSHIREVSAIIHLVRAYDNNNITHVENTINPQRDIELINTELVLKDIETVSKRIESIKGKARSDKKVSIVKLFLEDLLEHLGKGLLASQFRSDLQVNSQAVRSELFLLTDKPMIYLINANEDSFQENSAKLREFVGNSLILSMDIKLEAELSELDEREMASILSELNISETGLDMLTRECYKLLGLISFFTEGTEEVRAWTIKKGDLATDAGATIHTDFKTKFIAVDVCHVTDYLNNNGWLNAKDKGKVRLEGRDYVVKDGDIMFFKHGL